MSFEHFMNAATESLHWSYKGWRCIHCGEIVDALIFLNRGDSSASMKVKILEEEDTTAAQEVDQTDFNEKAIIDPSLTSCGKQSGATRDTENRK